MGEVLPDVHVHKHPCGHVVPGFLKQNEDASPRRSYKGAGQKQQEAVALDERRGLATEGEAPEGHLLRFGLQLLQNAREQLREKSHPQESDVVSRFFSRADIPCFLPSKVRMVEGYWSVICQCQSAMKNNNKKRCPSGIHISIYLYILFFFFCNKATNIKLLNRCLRL